MPVANAHTISTSLKDLDEWAMAVRQLEAKGGLPGGMRTSGPTPSLEGLAVRAFPEGLLPPTVTLRRKATNTGDSGSGQVLTLYAPSTLDSAVAAYSSMVPIVIAVPPPTSSSLKSSIEENRVARQHHASSSVQSALAEREQQSLAFLELVVGGSSVEYDAVEEEGTLDCQFIAVDMMTLHQLLLLPDHAIVSAPNPLLGNLPPGADAAAASTQYYSNPDRTLTAVSDAIWRLNGAALLSILLPVLYLPPHEGDYGGTSFSSSHHSPLSFSGWTTLRLSHRGGDGAPPASNDGVCNTVPPSPFYNALVGSTDEANSFGATPTIDRVHYSYLCVLSYLGWRLHCEETGELDRHRGWKQRYATLLAAPPTTTTTSVLPPLDTVLTALLTFLLGMRLVTFATRLVLYIVDEAKAGRLAHLVIPEGSVVRTTLLPILSTSLYLDGPVMGPEEVARVEATIKKMVDNDSDSE